MGANAAFLFPGQGAQSVGMAAELCERSIVAKEIFDQAADILGYDLLKLCSEGPAEELDSTVVSQPALYTASIAALEQLKLDDQATVDDCVAAAGLSLGEYTALAFAGVFSFEDGLQVVAERGAAMQEAAEATPSGMVSVVGVDVDKAEELCQKVREQMPDEVLQVANLLCPGNTVVSGTTAACERLVEGGEARFFPLAVAGAFHTPLMQPAVERLKNKLASVEFRPPRLSVISNVDAEPHDDPDEIRDLLIQQVVQPVRWEQSVRKLLDDYQIEKCFEIGAGEVLRGLMKRIQRKFPFENVPA